jgi:hypothetical protein
MGTSLLTSPRLEENQLRKIPEQLDREHAEEEKKLKEQERKILDIIFKNCNSKFVRINISQEVTS